MTLIAGIDDAGRGPVIGPLVIAGVLFYNYQISILRDLGIRDSKLLSKSRRMRLALKIKELAVNYIIVECSPAEIDEVVLKGKKLRKLNWLEAKKMAEVIQKLAPDVAYIDASDILEKRFGRQISDMLSRNVKIISEHHADSKYPIVSAASILAKTHRDEVLLELRKTYGDFGSGYSSDPKTRKFLLDWIRKGKKLPNIVRKSWKTIGKLKANAQNNVL